MNAFKLASTSGLVSSSTRMGRQLMGVGRILLATTQQRRNLLTSVQEPDLATSTVPERPCTVILAEDAGFYEHSWHDQFAQQLTSQHGISYAQFSLCRLSVDGALQELAQDLAPYPQTVLVARGPWMSWQAQLYLESTSLAGLVLVDPLSLDDQNSINQFDLIYQKKRLKNQPAYRLFQECVQHWDHWTLRLEPGSVPMMVLNSIARPGFAKAAENTARRHAGDSLAHEDSPWEAGNVALQKLLPKIDGARQTNDAVQKLVAWMDERVL